MITIFLIFWILLSGIICAAKCCGWFNENDLLAGKNFKEKTRNWILLMTKIWSVVAPMLFCIWILYYELEIILPKVGIELNSSSLLNVILKIASFVLVITSGFIGGKIWSKIAGHYLKEDELKKFIMQ